MKQSIIKRDALPSLFPTQAHTADFWEQLGRTVGTFGFLEDTLGRAIFAFTATRSYSDDEIEAAYNKWLPTLQRALSDPLGSLIDTYRKVVRDHPDTTIENIDDLVQHLKDASTIRNVLCHGSWPPPDIAGMTVPKFVNKSGNVFATPIDVVFLHQTQAAVVVLICSVIDTVTHMGWQFPGTKGPGSPIWPHESS